MEAEPPLLASALCDASWIGRETQDPYGEPLGAVLEIMRDRITKAPEWLLLGDGEEREGRLAPLAGALPTGRKIRLAVTAAEVRAAPRLDLGAELGLQGKREAAEHYGLLFLMRDSPSGRLTQPGEQDSPPRPEGAQSWTLSEADRRALVSRLAAAHAMEQASLKLLAAMRRRARDEELVHDVALHHRATRGHAEALRRRLDALGPPWARPLDWGAKMLAYVQAQLGRLRSTPEPADLRAAHEFERREIAAYREIERVAQRAGDRLTCEVARSNRMDEEAMVHTIESSRLWRAPGGAM